MYLNDLQTISRNNSTGKDYVHGELSNANVDIDKERDANEVSLAKNESLNLDDLFKVKSYESVAQDKSDPSPDKEYLLDNTTEIKNNNKDIRSNGSILKQSSDKRIIADPFSWLDAVHSLDKFATYTAILTNIGSGFVQLFNVSDEIKERLPKVVDFITNLSFIPYGLDGIRIGAKEKKNPYQAFGFAMELLSVWFSDIKLKYLVRGAATGTDQIWVATDQKLDEEHGIKEGRFDTWADGLIKVPKICWQMSKEILKDPIATLVSFKSNGHKALISSMGDIVATLGYAFTGKENIFGPIRDISAALFDWELVLSPKPLQKISGALFILESAFDFIARFMPSNSLRLFMNHISIGSGRAALMCYKNSDPNANKNSNDLSDNID